MIPLAFIATGGLPLLLAAAMVVRPWRPAAQALVPLAPLPGLATALLLPAGQAEIPWLVMGLWVGLDEPGRPILAATALVWLATALHWRATPAGRAGRTRFAVFFLCAMGGTLGAAMALGRPAFYTLFAMATLASYGLIVTGPGRNARRAGRLYLGLALAGEMMVLIALIIRTLSPPTPLEAALLCVGFGTKLGLVPLHIALPPAYRVAPSAGAAAVAGPVLTVAALGWLRFVPSAGAEHGAMAPIAAVILALGLFGAFYGAALGILQRRPAALLAYSSISQMGILMAALGLAMAAGGDTTALSRGAMLFAAHHLLAKAALFLGLGARRDRSGGFLVYPALVFLSLSLAGLALSGGALGKLAIETAALDRTGPEAALLATLLPFTSVATALVMARFLWLTRRASPMAEGPAWPAPTLAAAALVVPWLLVLQHHPHPVELAFGPSHLWQTLWPVALGAILAAAIGAVARGHPGWRRLAVRPGDIGAWLLDFRPSRLELPAIVWRWPARLPALPRLRLATVAVADLLLRPLAVYGAVYLALLLSLIVLAGLL